MFLYIFCIAIYIFHTAGGRCACLSPVSGVRSVPPHTRSPPHSPLCWLGTLAAPGGVSELSRVPELADPLAPHQASGSAHRRGRFGSPPGQPPRPPASLLPATVPWSRGDGLGIVTSRRREPPPCPAGAAGCQTHLSLQLDCGLRPR